MDSPTIIILVNLLSFYGALGVILIAISFLCEFCSKQNSQRWDAAFCGVTSEAILFGMSKKEKDATLTCIFVNKLFLCYS